MLAIRVRPNHRAHFAEHARQRLVRVLLLQRARDVGQPGAEQECVHALSRASVMACRKCRNSRVYWLIEPEISSSATTGGCFTFGPAVFQVDQRAAPPSCWRGACGANGTDAVTVRDAG